MDIFFNDLSKLRISQSTTYPSIIKRAIMKNKVTSGIDHSLCWGGITHGLALDCWIANGDCWVVDEDCWVVDGNCWVVDMGNRYPACSYGVISTSTPSTIFAPIPI